VRVVSLKMLLRDVAVSSSFEFILTFKVKASYTYKTDRKLTLTVKLKPTVMHRMKLNHVKSINTKQENALLPLC
jgi:hypothetical protein